MVLLSGRPPGDGDAAGMAIDVPDDASDVTPVDDRNSSVKASKTEEKTVKFRFVPSRTAASTVSPRVIHSHWLKHVQEEFGEHVQILDNHSRPVPKIDLLRWSDLKHQQHFNVHKTQKNTHNSKTTPTTDPKSPTARYHSPSDGNACFIIHRIRTTLPLKTIKAAPQISQLLRDNSCFLYQHHWSEDVWDTTQLGFVTNLDPQFYSAEQATVTIAQRLK